MADLIKSIKKSAQNNNTKIQSSEALKLEQILNKAFYLDKNVEEETKFINHIMTRGAETQERSGLHASALIISEKEFCIRAQVLSLIYKQLQGEQIPIGLKRIFEEGNSIHEKWQRLFIRAGYSKTENLDNTQYNKEYMVSFTPDIICKIPDFSSEIMIGEIKSVNTMQYKRMISHPTAKKQLQLYMYLSGIKKGFVLNEDKNTQDFNLEIYNYNPLDIELPIQRLEEIKYLHNKVYEKRKMVKRPSQNISSNSKQCLKCAMREACWDIGKGKVLIE